MSAASSLQLLSCPVCFITKRCWCTFQTRSRHHANFSRQNVALVPYSRCHGNPIQPPLPLPPARQSGADDVERRESIPGQRCPWSWPSASHRSLDHSHHRAHRLCLCQRACLPHKLGLPWVSDCSFAIRVVPLRACGTFGQLPTLQGPLCFARCSIRVRAAVPSIFECWDSFFLTQNVLCSSFYFLRRNNSLPA